MNINLLRSDPAETDSSLANTAFTLEASPKSTDEIDVNDFDDVDIYLEVLTLGSTTEYTVLSQSTGKNTTPASTDWATLQSDDGITAGVVTLADYKAKQDPTTPAAGTFHWNFPARGAQMRFQVFADNASGTFTLRYKRNVRS